MLKLRGVSVYPTAIERVLRGFPELGMEWQLVIDRRSDRRSATQEITVKAEISRSLSSGERVQLAERIADRLKAQTGIRPGILLLDLGSLAPADAAEGRVKTRRVVEIHS
jgi:phenylacetate-coenzyme A ligase PaaK-like adenylate-forming protein